MTLTCYLLPLALYAGLFLAAPWAKPESPVVRRSLLLLLGLLTLRYHYWRLSETLPAPFERGALVSYLFYGVEAFIGYFAWRRRAILSDTVSRTPEVERNLSWYGGPESAPLVDILIPTYDESVDILRTTIMAASHQVYPRFRVWVLDDGRRDTVDELCSELSVHYLRRDDNAHFKAGNLDHAYRHLLTLDEQPAHVAVFDADFVPYPTFIQRTVALMKESRVAIVQTPQYFHTPDPFQYAFDAHAVWPEDFRAWSFRSSSLEAQQAASCCGTSFLLRMDALREIGGFPVGWLLEDALLGMTLAQHGFRTIYLHERLSVGRGAEGLSELRRQRLRWTSGEMQMLLAPWRALGHRLALRLRLRMLIAIAHWFLVVALPVAWLLIPIVYWSSGVAIFRASNEDVLTQCAPMLLTHFVVLWMSRGALMPITTQATSLAMTPTRLRGGLRQLFRPRSSTFGVTPKGLTRERLVIHWGAASWMGLIALALVGTMTYRALHPFAGAEQSRYLGWNLAASYVALLILIVAFVPCFERPRRRRMERYGDGERVRSCHGDRVEPCRLLDISVHGALVSTSLPTRIGDVMTIGLRPDLLVAAVVVRKTEAGASGVEFRPTPAQEAKLIEMILCSRSYVPQPERWSWWRLSGALLRRAFA